MRLKSHVSLSMGMIAALAAACSSTERPRETGGSGIQTQALVANGTDVAQIEYLVQAVDCESGDPIGDPDIRTFPVSEQGIPGTLPELENNPFDAGAAHPFADLFMVVPPGCYSVTTTPLTDYGELSADCAPAHKTGIETQEGETVEIFLINQCSGDDPSALDAISALNQEPVLEEVWFDDSKFECGAAAKLCAYGTDPDGDSVDFELELEDSACEVIELVPGDGEQCWELECSEPGKHAFSVRIYDLLSSDGGIERVEDWLAGEGYPGESHAELASFAYVDGLPIYLDADGDGYGDPETAELACDEVPDGFVENGDDCNDEDDAVSPEGSETCNDIDDDCDGEVDEGAGCGGVEITAGGYAYGHHGACEGWNLCGDASTCALWACNNEGYDTLVSYGPTAACGASNPFTECHLMFNGPTGGVEYNWWRTWHGDPPSGSCDVMVVSQVVCADPSGGDGGGGGGFGGGFGGGGDAGAPPDADAGVQVNAAARAERAPSTCRGETCTKP